MADYNLGTAHGRIVIEYENRASEEAQSDFQKVSEKARWLHGQLRSVFSGIKQLTTEGGQAFNTFGRSVVALGGAAAILGGVAKGITTLGGAGLALRGTAGALSTLIFGMRGLPESAQGFPPIIKNMILLSAGLTALKAGTGILALVASRFTLLRPFAPIIRGLGNALFTLGLPIRAIAGVALAIAGLITGVRVATSLAKAITALTAVFGALSGVVGIINGIIGAIGQLSGVAGLIAGVIGSLTGAVATLATGFSGFSKALKFVPPAGGAASGAMDQMAKAAKNAARSIAAAQRAVDDALRDQARTFRDTGRQIANAQRALADAVESAARANVDAARRTRDAQRDLADALKAAARSAEDNAERVADAQRNVQRTAENAARSVVSASRALASAVKNEESAQRGLNEARRIALQQLAELQERVSDLALDQEGAAIALIEAQKNLEKVNSDALSTELDRRKAQYELAVAQERVNDVTEEAAKAAEENNAAIEKGVDGSQVVLDAQQALIDSQQNLKDSQDEYARAVRDANEANAEAAKNLATAVRDAAEDQIASQRRVADATEALALAQQEQVRTAQQGARDVADAQTALALAEESAAEAREDAARRVEDAFRSLAEAQEDAAESMKQAAQSAAGQEDPINKLSPAAQRLVRVLRDLKTEWGGVRKEVQEAMFAGIAEEVRELGNLYMPILREGLVGVAKEFNLAGKEATAFFKDAQTRSDVSAGFELTRQVVRNLTQALRPLLEAFRDIGIVGLEVFSSLTEGAGRSARGFADFIAEARRTGELREWIMRGVQAMSDLWTTVKNVGASLKLIFNGLSGNDGSGFLARLAEMTTNMRNFLESAKGQEGLRTLGEFLQRMADNTLTLVRAAFENLWPVVEAGKPLFEDLSRTFVAVFVGAMEILGPIFTGIMNFFSFLSPVISPILGLLLGLGIAWKSLGIILRLFLPLLGLLVSGINAVITIWRVLQFVFMTNPWIAIITALLILVVLIVQNWDFISQKIGEALDWIGARISEFGPWLYETFIQPFVDMGEAISSWWTGVMADFNYALAYIGALWTEAWTNIETWFNQKIEDIKTVLRDLFPFLFDEHGNLKSIEQMWTEAMDFIGRTVDEGIRNIGQWFRDLPGNIMRSLGGLGTDLWNAGVAAVEGLWNGFLGMGPWLWGQIMNWARQWIPGPILDFLGIASPSKYFRDEIGKMIPAGLMQGIDSMKNKVAQTAVAMVDGASGAAMAAAQASGLGNALSSEMAGQLAANGAITASATLTRAAVANNVGPATNGEGSSLQSEATQIGTLVLNVAGNLDPTNKLAWNQAMDSIREGIGKREKARK